MLCIASHMLLRDGPFASLSLRPSLSGIVSKRLNISLKLFHLTDLAILFSAALCKFDVIGVAVRTVVVFMF